MDRHGGRGNRAAEPMAVLEATLQDMQQQAGQLNTATQQQQRQDKGGPPPEFIGAPRFDGARQGYFFAAGEQGVG